MLIEFVLCLLAVPAAFLFPDLGGKWFAGIERWLNHLAQRRGWAVFSVGLIALAIRAALLPIEPIPQPQIHDEFSYLLLGDTFAHGRLANPTHPMWIHFETYHVNQTPRYVSMFYPAQGVLLAVGQVLFGHPFWGVWLSVGLMCAAICWMLQAWVPPIWALVGGLLAAIRLGGFNYWADSYWGGAAAALGATLVLGSLLRIRKKWRPRDAVILGFGFVILANSRPYEGLFFSLPAIAALIKWLFDRKFPPGISVRRIIFPLCLVLAVGAGAMLYYSWRTTGNPFLSPYVLNVRSYNPVPYFPWQTVKPTPHYDHVEMRDFYLGWWLDQFNFAKQHPIQLGFMKVFYCWTFFLGSVFTLPLFMSAFTLPYGLRFQDLGLRMRLLILVTCSTAIGIALPVFLNVHYAAPLTGAVYLFVIFSMQWLRRWKWHRRRTGLAIVRFTVTICVLMFVLQAGALSLHILKPGGGPAWFSPEPEIPGRAQVLRELGSRPGKLLVLVRYPIPRDREHILYEWVNNAADIDDSKIVWAHDMGAEKNQELLDYFRGREVWRVEPDDDPVKVSLLRPAFIAGTQDLPSGRVLGERMAFTLSNPCEPQSVALICFP